MAEGVLSCASNLAEWTPFTYLDNDDDDDDGVPKSSDLYGKYTWKIDNYSQINKREIRSSSFVVGGCKWYVLLYPQGCDGICNHLSLFLCVADRDKLLPGWSHFAQFTVCFVNKDPKRSKYSDTLHRFWKEEHDWGWKKFMEISKVKEVEGFINADTLTVKVQVQVIRERPDRLFRCLDSLYRRKLTRVYLTNVELIFCQFVEEHRTKLGKLLEDKARWSSFCAFWSGMDESSRRLLSREKSESIMKVMVKHFFKEKEVISTLVMESLYSGLKALEDWNKGKQSRGKCLKVEESRIPIVGIEEDAFILVDDVLPLIERAAMEPLPLRDEKGHRDGIEHDEARLRELGCRTIEMFVFPHIFSKIEVAYQEFVALKKQEDLIREEEATSVNQIERKSKLGVDKGKKSKERQRNRNN